MPNPNMSNVRLELGPSLTSLQSDASKARAFFSRGEPVNSLPFVHSFPRNSCEVVPAFLATALQNKYIRSTVAVVMAYKRASNEWHFWVDVDGFVVDATAHQFPEHEHPLVCVGPSPLAARFPDIERLQPEAALRRMGRPDYQQILLGRRVLPTAARQRKLLSSCSPCTGIQVDPHSLPLLAHSNAL